jgi:hypothetical protein
MNHGRPAVLEPTHKARFMKDSMRNVMNVMKIQRNQLEEKLLRAQNTKAMLFVLASIMRRVFWNGRNDTRRIRTPPEATWLGQ